MREKVCAKIEAARQRALRLQKLSKVVEEVERKRDACLYNLFGDLHGIEGDLRKLSWKDRRKIFGDLLDFRTNRQLGSLLLRQVYPELDAKKRAKYGAVLRYVTATKSPREKVKDFVRKNGSINGCVAKESKLRREAARRSRS
jgi:hypothetical protein